MKSLMTFVGILAFNLPNIAMASDFSCPVNANVSSFTCSGTVKVKTLAELNAYRNDLGVVAKKPTIAKNLQIDFNPALTSDLVISTPCLIRIPSNVVMTSTANICLHGTKGIVIDENFKFTGKNLKLESKEEVIINKNSVIKAQDIKLLSIGVGDASKTYIRDGANVEAANLSIESFDKGFIGKNSIVKLTGALGIYSLGDDEASVREGSRVEAAKIEISSTEETRVAKLTTLIASEIILNGVKCTINKTAVITADDRLGNCFLTSTTNKAKFSINKNQGTNPLTVSFNASSIADAKGFVWSFGDGETLNSLTPNVTHVYSRVGSFTATLKYATKDNYKGLKSAGAIQIDVKEAPISNPVVPVPPRGNLKYQTDGTFVYLRGYIRKTTYDIANAYYVIDDNQNNKIQIPNFYQNSLTSVEMNTYGRHKVTMYVVDVQGQVYSKSMNIYVDEFEEDIYPYMRLDYDQSAPKTIFFDLSWSFNPIVGETLKDFTIDFGDGQSAVLTNTAFITHTYAQAGTYLVKAIGKVNGNEDFDEYEIEVTDENTPIMNPVAGFEYQIHDYAGNVMFTNDRSGTPNGEIISYIWDFGDGTTGYGKDASNFYAPGDYLVTLTVVDTAGLRSSQTQKITIVAEGDDIASMLDCWSDGSKHLGCEVVAFDKFNQITRVKLDWGDGTSENLTVPDFANSGFSLRDHIYESYGTFIVKLSIDTSREQTKHLYYQHVFDPISLTPVASINCVSNNLLVHCDGIGSYDLSETPLSYTFEYDDQHIETNMNGTSTHAYTTAGLHKIKMTLRNGLGLESVVETQVQTFFSPTYPPSVEVICSSNRALESTCFANASDSNGYIVSYKYDWGDGQSDIYSSSSQASHLYLDGGVYRLRLTVTDNDGLIASSLKDIEVKFNHSPVSRFDCFNIGVHRITCNSDWMLDPDEFDFIAEYKWDLGNGESIITLSPYLDYTYVLSSTYQITLQVKDSYGAIAVSSKSHTTQENLPPIASGYCSSFGPQNLSCYSNSYDPDGGAPLLVEWTIEDRIINDSLFNVTIASSGIKIVTLKVTDFYGAFSTISLPVTVLENLAPIANADCTLADSKTLLCKSKSYDQDGVVSKSKWTLSNGKIILGSSFAVDFSSDSSISYVLEVTDNLGKTSTYSGVVNNVNVPSVAIPTETKCPIVEDLLSKDCSEQFFIPSSLQELHEYLASGKYDSNNKLLNLELKNFQFASTTSIATSCSIKISKNTQITSADGSVCLRGANIYFDENSKIVGMHNDIDILADRSIIFNKAKIETEGSVNISTLQYLPFQGKVSFENESEVIGSSIKIDSKSSLVQDSSSIFNSSALMLNGGNCIVNSDVFVGDCNNQPFPESLAIIKGSNSIEKNYSFEIEGLQNENYQYSWRLDNDQITETKENSLVGQFDYPGKHQVEVSIMDSKGKFIVIKTDINSYVHNFKRNQLIMLYFVGSENQPEHINAQLNLNNINLIKSKQNPEIYFAEIGLGQVSSGTISVPLYQFHMNFSIENMPEITDGLIYFDEVMVREGIDTRLEENLEFLEIKNKIAALSIEEQIRFAKLVQANLQDVEVLTTNYFRNNLMESFLASAYASGEDTQVSIDVHTTNLMKSWVKNIAVKLRPALAGYALGGALIGAGLGTLPGGLAEIGAGSLIIYLTHKKERGFFNNVDKQLKDLMVPIDTIKQELILKDAYSSEVFPVRLKATFGKVNEVTPKSVLIKNMIAQKDTINKQISFINSVVSLYNSDLNVFASQKMEYILYKKFPNTQMTGYLNASYITDVKITSPISENVKIKNYTVEGNKLNIIFEAKETTTVKVEVIYNNEDLGLDEKIIFDVLVVAPSSPVITLNSIDSIPQGVSSQEILGFAGVDRKILVEANDENAEYDGSTTTFTWKVVRNYPSGSKPLVGPVEVANNIPGIKYLLSIPYRDVSYSLVVTAENKYGKTATLSTLFYVLKNKAPTYTIDEVSCPLKADGYSNGEMYLLGHISDDQYLIDGNTSTYTTSERSGSIRFSDGLISDSKSFQNSCPIVKPVYHWKISVTCQKGDLNVCYGSCPELDPSAHEIVNTGLQWTYVKIYDEHNVHKNTLFIGEANNELGSSYQSFYDPNYTFDPTKMITVDIASACARGGNGPSDFEL